MVVADSTHAPLGGVVRLRQPGTPDTVELARRHTDGTGAFAFDSLPPGGYIMQTVWAGGRIRTDTVLLATTSGLTVQIPLELLAGEGCEYAISFAKVPWWKFW